MMDPYMTKTASLLRIGKARLEGLRARAGLAGVTGAAERKMKRVDSYRKLKELEAQLADASHNFEELRAPGDKSVAELKIRLEKAWAAFESGLAWQP